MSRELLSARMYHGTGGLSGISWRNLSICPLNVKVHFSSLTSYRIMQNQLRFKSREIEIYDVRLIFIGSVS